MTALLKSHIMMRTLRFMCLVRIDGRRQLAITAYCVHSFFDASLNGGDASPLTMSSHVYSEIQVLQSGASPPTICIRASAVFGIPPTCSPRDASVGTVRAPICIAAPTPASHTIPLILSSTVVGLVVAGCKILALSQLGSDKNVRVMNGVVERPLCPDIS